jgi:hypothetical protein
MNPYLFAVSSGNQIITNIFFIRKMENKDQLDQNPALENGQEANSQPMENETIDNSMQPKDEIAAQNEVQPTESTKENLPEASLAYKLEEAEVETIKQLISSNLIAEEKSQAAEPEKEDTKEVIITDADKAAILELIASNKLPEKEKRPAKVKAKPLITKGERNEIAELIASNQAVASHMDEDDESEDDELGMLESMNKLELVELLEETVTESELSLIKSKVASIKVRFLQLNKQDIEKEYEQFLEEGGDKESFEHTDDPLEVRFKAAFGQYKENKARFNEQLEKQKQINLKEKLGILEDLKQLISSEETLKKTYDEFKVLQDKWKESGPVPAGEINTLWNNYHFLVEKFFDKVKINRELRDLDMKKNLESKIELCEKAEELLLEKSVVKAFKMLQQYHDDWKEIGPVPQDKKDEIWDRFKNATDQINQRRREHYNELQKEQEHNYEAKLALCDKIEELIAEMPNSISQWQNRTRQISELFGVWKSVGQAPKKQNDEIWKRFKSSMDSFFDNKKEYFGKLKEQQFENYNLKLDLCAQAEAQMESTEWRNTTESLKRLQEDWKKIGPVPKKHSDKIWKRFRSACDTFFKRKSEFFSHIRENEAENLTKKKELIERITNSENLKDKVKNLEAIKSFQREWMEIGHVPIKAKDQLQAQYRKALDSLFEKMKVSEVEMTAVEYEGMIETIKDRPDGRDHIRRESMNLSNRIAKLRDEINLWENNIGFFANSKQADIMKAEYEKKIKRAKNDLTILETKLKVLRD